jgi:hypothetical protein
LDKPTKIEYIFLEKIEKTGEKYVDEDERLVEHEDKKTETGQGVQMTLF